MDVIVPNWLDEEFLKKLLEQNQNGGKKYKVRITKHEVVKRVPKGANYLSNMLGVNIEFTKKFDDGSEGTESLYLVAKVPLEEEGLGALNKCGIIVREVEAYYDLLWKMTDIVTKDGDHALSPKCYKCDIDELTILEDLKPAGYVLLDKVRQMGYDLTAATLKHLAKYHASSIRHHEIDPKLVERVGRHLMYTNPMDPDIKATIDPIMGEERIDVICDEFDKYPESRRFVRFLRNLKPMVWDKLLSALEKQDEELNVLAHGDVHISNLLVLYDEKNNVQNIKFIDYQLIRYASLTIDILYFFATSVKHEVFTEHFHELTAGYLKHLNFYLDKFGSDQRLDEESFRKSLEKRELYHLLIAMFILPFMLSGYETAENGEAIHHQYPFFEYSRVEKYKQTVVRYMEYYSNRPWFQNLNK